MQKRLHNSHKLVKSGEWVEIKDVNEVQLYDYLMLVSEQFVISGQLDTNYNKPGYLAITPNKGGESTYFDLKSWYCGEAKLYGFTPNLPETCLKYFR